MTNEQTNALRDHLAAVERIGKHADACRQFIDGCEPVEGKPGTVFDYMDVQRLGTILANAPAVCRIVRRAVAQHAENVARELRDFPPVPEGFPSRVDVLTGNHPHGDRSFTFAPRTAKELCDKFPDCGSADVLKMARFRVADLLPSCETSCDPSRVDRTAVRVADCCLTAAAVVSCGNDVHGRKMRDVALDMVDKAAPLMVLGGPNGTLTPFPPPAEPADPDPLDVARMEGEGGPAAATPGDDADAREGWAMPLDAGPTPPVPTAAERAARASSVAAGFAEPDAVPDLGRDLPHGTRVVVTVGEHCGRTGSVEAAEGYWMRIRTDDGKQNPSDGHGANGMIVVGINSVKPAPLFRAAAGLPRFCGDRLPETRPPEPGPADDAGPDARLTGGDGGHDAT